MIAGLLLSASPAWAAPCADPVTEADVRGFARRSSESIEMDDIAGHRRAWSDMLVSVPCLVDQLPREPWAELLVNEAIVREATAVRGWHSLLTVATRIAPDLDDIPGFLLEAWVPVSDPDPGTVDVPADAALFIDGILQPRVQDLRGEHIVQVWRDGRWRSAMVVNDGPPPAWLAPREAPPVAGAPDAVPVAPAAPRRPARAAGSIEIALGVALLQEGVPSGLAGLATHGVQPIARQGGVFWDAALPVSVVTRPGIGFTDSTAPWAYAGPALTLDGAHVGLGVGGFRLLRLNGDNDLDAIATQVHLTLGARNTHFDFEAGGGAGPAAAHLQTRAGWRPHRGPAGARFGLDGHLGAAWPGGAPADGQTATVLQLTMLARFGLAWGRAPRGRTL